MSCQLVRVSSGNTVVKQTIDLHTNSNNNDSNNNDNNYFTSQFMTTTTRSMVLYPLCDS